jgi:hypothetical protein
MKLKNCNGTQNLLTSTLMKKIPPLYGQDGRKSIAYVKLFLESWTWYITEIDPNTLLAFGKVFSPMCPDGEIGYFNVREIAETAGQIGQGAERDKWFKPTPLTDCKNPCS